MQAHFINAQGAYLGGFAGGTASTGQGEESQVPLVAPAHGIVIDAPPEHALDVLEKFSIVDGKAVGGKWNKSARPQPPQTPEQKVLSALLTAGAITDAQAAAALSAVSS